MAVLSALAAVIMADGDNSLVGRGGHLDRHVAVIGCATATKGRKTRVQSVTHGYDAAELNDGFDGRLGRESRVDHKG